MWYYVYAVQPKQTGFRTMSQFRNETNNVDQLSDELRQKGIRFLPKHANSLWVRLSNERDFTVLTFLLLRHNCQIVDRLRDDVFDASIIDYELMKIIG